MDYIIEILNQAREKYKTSYNQYDWACKEPVYDYDRFSIQLIYGELWLIGHCDIDYSPDHEEKLEKLN
jgi:hypothetical protein